jgi:hypothetical protein
MEEHHLLNNTVISPTSSQVIERNTDAPEPEEYKEDDVNVLSGDNTVDVDIEPDVKSNDLYLQLCSCSLIFNFFSNNSN